MRKRRSMKMHPMQHARMAAMGDIEGHVMGPNVSGIAREPARGTQPKLPRTSVDSLRNRLKKEWP